MRDERFASLGRRIREMRQERRLSQAELADLAGLSTNYLGEIERGQREASLKSFLAIASALKVNPSDLFAPLDTPLTKDELIRRLRQLLSDLDQSA